MAFPPWEGRPLNPLPREALRGVLKTLLSEEVCCPPIPNRSIGVEGASLGATPAGAGGLVELGQVGVAFEAGEGSDLLCPRAWGCT